ncbi:ANK-REP-REGION domain-containing protein [Mycena chlorophos]|uniref:ANK-REP-REGION domain-containing protein n=1 Tax=Mycena chlorophos TaxID=658473 RepID=A0A8H6TQU6_MYCCL|nr:ANK-REP-REGION domain-containing protein [Mycena chlorophos]
MSSFSDLPAELVLAISDDLPIRSLNALAQTCRHIHEVLGLELENRLTPALAQEILPVAIRRGQTHTVAKLLAPPHSLDPEDGLSLLVAASRGHSDVVALLLDAGADITTTNDDDEKKQALHFAVIERHLETARALLERGAPVDAKFGWDGSSETALHRACGTGQVEMAALLLDHGAALECEGHFGTPLGFAVRNRRLEVVRMLLERGADATVDVPLHVIPEGAPVPPAPLRSNLLYLALNLRRPVSAEVAAIVRRFRANKAMSVPGKWWGSMDAGKKELMMLLMEHGASKDGALALVEEHIVALAEVAVCEPEELLQMVREMVEEVSRALVAL